MNATQKKLAEEMAIAEFEIKFRDLSPMLRFAIEFLVRDMDRLRKLQGSSERTKDADKLYKMECRLTQIRGSIKGWRGILEKAKKQRADSGESVGKEEKAAGKLEKLWGTVG